MQDKAIKILLNSFAIIIPLIFSTAFYSPFSTPKLLALRIITLIIILLWIWKVFVQGKFAYRKSKLNLFLIAYAICGILSTITSTHVFSSLFGVETRFLGIFTQLNLIFLPFLIFNFLTEKKELLTFLKLLIFSATISAFYGILQYFGFLQETFSWTQDQTLRVFGTFSHSNNLGAFLGISLLLSLGLISNFQKKWRIILVSAMLIQFVALLLTGSRAALIATILSFLIVSANKLRSIFIALISLLIIGTVFWQPISKIPVIQRSIQTFEQIPTGKTLDRISWWKSSLSMIKDKPILGFGLSTFKDNYNQYRRTDYKIENDLQDQISPESSHMEYLDIAVNQGLIGLIVFLSLIGFILLNLKKSSNNNLKIALLGGILVHLFQTIFNFGVIDTLTVFYLLLGVAASASIKSSIKTFELNFAVKYLLTILIIFLISFGANFTFKEAKAEVYYKLALANNNNKSLEFFSKTINLQPYRYEYFQSYADFLFRLSTSLNLPVTEKINYLSQSIENYEKALNINSSHPSTFYNLGLAYWNYGNTEKAFESFKKAIQLSPNNPLYPNEVEKIYLRLNGADLPAI